MMERQMKNAQATCLPFTLNPLATLIKRPRVSLIAGCIAASLAQPAVAFDASFELSSLLSANGGDGSTGFVINGHNIGRAGRSVSAAGDVNGDGIDDVIISAPYTNGGNGGKSGLSYVVFGSNSGLSSSFELSSLRPINGGDGSNGFVLPGIDVDDFSGSSVSGAGDVNGDGFADVIVGAGNAGLNGESYVVFGASSMFASLELSDLNGSNGFVLNGIDPGDNAGSSVSGAGDVNGDGFDDVIIGSFAEENYVVFGASSMLASLELSALNGSNGFTLNGIDAGDDLGQFSQSLSGAGDVNGDGFADMIVGASGGDGIGGGDSSKGESYVVFGASSMAASLPLSTLNGTNGFVMYGIDEFDFSGRAVSGAGDVNGDGFADVIIGAQSASSYAGESYVVFGASSQLASLDLSALNGSNGFVLNGIDASDFSGTSVSGAGDINGDGFADVIVGAEYADPKGDTEGESYIVFGASSLPASLELSALNGSNGFVMNGIDAVDRSGSSVSGAGDVNGDGIDDVIIGAPFADPNGNYTGESYVVFGEREVVVPHDFNGDGTSDILLRNTLGASEIRSVSNNIVTSINDLGTLPLVFTIEGTGDFNADGTTDVLWRRDDGLTLIQSITNNAQTSFTSIGFLPLGSTIEGTGDFNADGTSDVLWRRSDGLTVIWSINNNIVTDFTSLGYLPSGSTVGGTGDYNADGTSDILWRRADGLTVIWPISNNTRVSFASLGYMPLSFTIEGTGDFNADGTSDILWRRTDGLTVIWSIDNNIRTSFTSIGFLPVTSAIEGTGDYNADGTSDILWRRTDGLTVIWTIGNNSVSSFTSLGFLPLTLEIQ